MYQGDTVVANITRLSQTSLADGQTAYVLSVLDPFKFVSSGAQFTIDNITVAATALGGNTRWVRQFSCHPKWRLGRDDWYIDPSGGNDENDGTVAHPIKTGAELARRWGSQNIVQQSGSSSDFAVNIHVLGDIVAPDYLSIDVKVPQATGISVIGTPTLIISSPAGATAITVENQATNTPWNLVDAVTAGAITAGARLRWTAGPAAGACAYAAKNTGATVPNSWRFSQPQISNTSGFSPAPTPANPAVGNAYVVERLTQIQWGYMNITPLNQYLGFSTFCTFNDVQIVQNGATIQQLNYGTNGILITIYVFNQCQLGATTSSQNLYFSNCCFLNGGLFYQAMGVSGGLFLAGTGGTVVWSASQESQFSNDILIQGAQLFILNSVVGNVGVFDAAGDAVSIGPLAGTNDTIAPVNAIINDRVWGSGSSGTGIHVRAGSRAVISGTVPNVTGATDFALGTTGQERTFINASGIYSAAPISPTWANFVDNAQFAHNAHNLQQDSHLVTL